MLSWVNELVRLPSAAASAAVGNTPPSHGSLLFASSLLLTHLYQRYAAYHTRKLNCSQKSVGSGVGKQRPPVAKKVKHEIVFGYHPSQYRGDNVMNPPKKRIDYYQWLRDDDRKDKEILKYIELENQYCEQRLRHLKPLSRHIYQEAKSYMKETDTECPYPRGSYHYFTRTFEGQAYKILCRYESKGKEILQPIESIEAMDGVKVETILNENEIAQGKDYCHVEYAEVSPSQNMLAFAVDFSGYEEFEIHLKDLKYGHMCEVLVDTAGDFEWGYDDSCIFYTVADDENRPYQLWLHEVGVDQEEDELIFEENDQRFSVSIDKSASGEFLILSSNSIETSEEYIIHIGKRDGCMDHKIASNKKILVQPRTASLRYDCEHSGNYLLIVTNANDAHNNKLAMVPIFLGNGELNQRLSMENWKDFKSYDPSIEISEVLPFEETIVVFGRENGSQKVWLASKPEAQGKDSAKWSEVVFSESLFSVEASKNFEYSSDVVRLSYSSYITPQQVITVNLKDGSRKVLKEKEVPGYNRELYTCTKIFLPSRDGVTKVPVSMVYLKELPSRTLAKSEDSVPQGSPMLLDGYGSYGYSQDPDFNFSRLPLLNRGIIYAIAHIRGGGEMGQHEWYFHGGKFLTKMNTFYDFIDCAEGLINLNITSSKKLAIIGRSAGGLLMGAVANMAPHLFKAVIAEVPFVDVLTTMSDPTIPLTAGEWEEWGNPNLEEFYDYMSQYCPYTNVKKQAYPNMFFTSGLHDPRVPYWEPIKLVCKLREHKTDDNILVLKTDTSSGHFSASDRYKFLEEKAFELAFIIDQLERSEVIECD